MYQVLTDLVGTLALMALPDPTGPQAKMEIWDKEETEETLVQRVWLVLRDSPAPQALWGLRVMPAREERLAPEDPSAPLAPRGRED